MTEFYFFSGGAASQWSKSEFKFAGNTFNCAEQFMMSGKAKLFHDEVIFDKIMACKSPKKQKDYGRQVANFDNDVWFEHATDIVTVGNIMKFDQDEYHRNWLIEIKRHYDCMVEASPWDDIWGIGVNQYDERRLNRHTWQGLNLLGECIDDAYDYIMCLDTDDINLTSSQLIDFRDGMLMMKRVYEIFKN